MLLIIGYLSVAASSKKQFNICSLSVSDMVKYRQYDHKVVGV